MKYSACKKCFVSIILSCLIMISRDKKCIHIIAFFFFFHLLGTTMMQVTENSNIKDIIKDTITLLCKNGLNYEESCSIEALIGITLDKSNVILLNVNEVIELEGKSKNEENEPKCSRKRSSVKSSDDDHNENAQPKKRKVNRESSGEYIQERSDQCDVGENSYNIHQSNGNTLDTHRINVKTEPPSTLDVVNITPDSTGHAPNLQYQPVFPTSLPLHNNTLPTGHSPYDFEPSPTTFSPKKTTVS